MSEIPQAVEAEKNVLGAMILNALKPFETGLSANDFYIAQHGEIFSAICGLTEDGGELSPALLSDFLQSKRSERQDAFSVYSLMQMTAGIPFGLKYSQDVRLIKTKAARRQIMQMASGLQEKTLNGDESNDQLINETLELLEILREKSVKRSDGFRPLSEIAADAAEKYAEMAKGKTFNVPTGITEIDRVTRGGIAPGDVWIVGAFTGQGKSALALQMARNQAENGYTVGAVSREMLDFENFERLHSAKSETPLWLIKPGMDALIHDRLKATIADVANLPILINSQTGNIFELRRQVKRLVEKQGAKVLYVDYLQLLEASDAKSNWSRTNEIEKCSRMLKAMAMDFQIGVVALAQYNRLANYAGKAENHSFDGSSAIEKDASVVLHLELEKVEEGAQIPKWRKATVRMGKGRQSPQIETTLWFRGECFTFSEKAIADLSLAKTF